MKNRFIDIKSADECCGCRNCENICPNKAVTMVENTEGFIYPQVDAGKCINCGLCQKACPQINKAENVDYYLSENICYALKNKDKQIQMESTSGGAFSAFAKYILNNGGYVCGSVMDDNLKVRHIIVNDIKDLSKLYGSKYVFSDVNNVFMDIKTLLNDNKKVLFCGVPCQVNALINFLSKRYDNLFTIELICHGAPSQKLFDKYIEYYENQHKCKVLKYEFRSKKAAAWGTYKALAVTEKNGKIKEKIINADFDKYYNTFLQSKAHRESCYKCKFADVKRYADITIGDFWGIEHIKPEFSDSCGVSKIIINSRKGLNLFESIKESVVYDEVKFADIMKHNSQLQKPVERKKIRDIFYENIDSDRFFYDLKIDRNIKSYIKILVPSKLKLKLKNIIK